MQKTILIALVRYLPIIYSLAVVFGACETLYAIHVGNILDYGDYIMYDTPISDNLSGILSTSLFELAVLYLITNVLKFCSYHRVFIWFLVGNRVLSITFSFIVVDNILNYACYITIISFIIASLIALKLHLRSLKFDNK